MCETRDVGSKAAIGLIAALLALFGAEYVHAGPSLTPQERLVEWTIESRKTYSDPFNDVDVDVVFTRGKNSWRAPTFWRGGSRWTVRFAPPEPGVYRYRLESTDKTNPDLNGHAGQVTITPYTGDNALLKHGALRISATGRYFEHADGTPFFWLADTWWMGLSDRLPWSGFQQLTADRKAKGFTVVQVTAGLVPFEEVCPEDPGCANEGGQVWESGFTRINPGYFDAADRRIQALVDAGLMPEIEGAYTSALAQLGVAKMKKHWRYVIARYGAYPVIWNLADEIVEPPANIASRMPALCNWSHTPVGWAEVARYVRTINVHRHPVTVNEMVPPCDVPFPEDSLTDFDQLQPGHWGWPTLALEVMQLNRRYARTDVTKPVVVGEIGYELLGGTHLEDFQRMAFWLAMLNGAAGHSYGAGPTYEVNNPAKPLQRNRYTFLNWDEGMNLPGSYQLGLSGKFLQQFPWWQFTPHPEWVTPRGTTLLEPHRGVEFDVSNFDFNEVVRADLTPTDTFLQTPEAVVPGGQWKARGGSFRKPYAAGIPGRVRILYIPAFGLVAPAPPTVLHLEQGIRYHAFYWEPMLGIRFDLGVVEVPPLGAVQLREDFADADSKDWSDEGVTRTRRQAGTLQASGDTLSVNHQMSAHDIVVTVDAHSHSSAGLLLRYQDRDNYVAAVYSAKEKTLHWLIRTRGVTSAKLGAVPVSSLGPNVRLKAEVRSNWAAAEITDGQRTYSTEIVDTSNGAPDPPADSTPLKPNKVGLMHEEDGETQQFDAFEVRQSPKLVLDTGLERKLHDARGTYRGELSGPGWEDWGRRKAILLNSYRPERFPAHQDWILVLDAHR